MATYYIDPINGNDGDDGLSWANAFLTLNGAEDEPVAANDTIYVGPGVYRELLTLDVSGGAGNQITYIGDVTGEHTDGIGGVIRVTGSNNDITAARANCITAAGITHRTFRGFRFDIASGNMIQDTASPTDWIMEDCRFTSPLDDIIEFTGDSQADCTFRRCIFIGCDSGRYQMYFSSTGIQDSGHVVENCQLIGASSGRGIGMDDVGGVYIRNCLLFGHTRAVDIFDALPLGYTAVTVENCTLEYNTTALRAAVLGEIVEDFNTFFQNTTNRTNVNVGGNSVTSPSLARMPLLHAGASQISGFRFPLPVFGELSEWSQIAAITGSNEPTEDLFGIVRPTTASKNSWGPVQFHDRELETITVQAGTYARTLLDAGSVLVRRVPHVGAEVTVTLYMRYGNTYAGNLPQMVIKQPGAADQVSTVVAAADTWEQLSDTFTPNADPGYFEVWALSRNTAGIAATTRVIYDTMDVN